MLFFALSFSVCNGKGKALSSDFTIQANTDIRVYSVRTQRPVAKTALDMFANDVKAVLGCSVSQVDSESDADIIILRDTTIPPQGFVLDVKNARLYIKGADEHGMAYGLLEVSRLMGVSPWEYWADCIPHTLPSFTLRNGFHDQQSPAVAYRGIFINDEDWGLNPWATRQEPEAWTIKSGRIKGALGPKVHERIFQLMLRLRANYYWPAMHECTQPFFTVKGNREMAARYGIYVGGSHCEPMATSPAVEWDLRGKGDYNYVTNKDAVQDFWRERLNEVGSQEMIYTLGMRGVHDGSMQGVKTKEDKLKYLQQVIDDQREMLLEVQGSKFKVQGSKFNRRQTERRDELAQSMPRCEGGKDAKRIKVQGQINSSPTGGGWEGASLNLEPGTLNSFSSPTGGGWEGAFPQVFVPYKEVLDIYKSGLHVPDDVTLMWTDDNYGYIRHFPDSIERQRMGGNGVYYHVSYWGRPHDYLWLNSLSPDLLQSQMTEAYHRGIRQMWILNVGDIKPSEYQIELFMQLAWSGCNTDDFLHYFVKREFGAKHTEEISEVLKEYFRLSHEMKPEHMAGTRTEEADKAYWNKIHPILGDWTQQRIKKRIRAYQTISDKAEKLFSVIPDNRMDAFFQLVKYPVQGAAQMNFKYLCPDLCLQAYDSIQSLTHYYNKVMSHGKWDGIMNCAPRQLPVFDRVTPDQLPSYPLQSEWKAITQVTADTYTFAMAKGTDSVTIRVDLVPNHPFVGNRLAFALVVDGHQTPDIEFQTYDRSEEWKQNVIRGYATRIVTVPVTSSARKHTLRFLPLTEGTKPISLDIRQSSLAVAQQHKRK